MLLVLPWFDVSFTVQPQHVFAFVAGLKGGRHQQIPAFSHLQSLTHTAGVDVRTG